jgi:hypothetical protein
MDAKIEECIKACTECYKTCTQTITHCLEMGGEHASPEHVDLLRDCAEICKLSVDFMLRDSQFAAQLCGLCADICERCAEQCEQMAGDDETMQQCADTCRRCVETCRAMS